MNLGTAKVGQIRVWLLLGGQTPSQLHSCRVTGGGREEKGYLSSDPSVVGTQVGLPD